MKSYIRALSAVASLLLAAAAAHAQTTDINFINNSPNPVTVMAGATEHLVDAYDKTTLWQVERDSGFQSGEVTDFDVTVPGAGISYQLQRTGKWVGSGITSKLKLADQPEMAIFEQEDFVREPLSESPHATTFYGSSNKPITKLYHDVTIGIDQPVARYQRQEDNKHLAVLTMNTQLMPFYTGGFNNLNHPARRAADIPELVKDYDVVIFQELYDRGHRAKIVELMEEDYPYHTRVIGDGTSNMLTGGVMIFSHWPIEDERTVKYDRCTGIDCFADKGGQLARVNKHGKQYYFLATHMQSENEALDQEIRAHQLERLRGLLESAEVPADAPVFLAGDLNIDAYTNEYQVLKQHFPHPHYQPLGLKYTYDCKLNDMVVEDNRQLLDYLFPVNGWAQPQHNETRVRVMRGLNDAKMWPNVELSDHFAVEGAFVFS